MPLRLAPLLGLLFAASAAAQPVPDTLRSPVEADSITVFGWTVDADGDRVLVGARIWPPPYPRAAGVAERADHHGIVFVYRLQPDGTWAIEGELRADYISPEDCFSWSMDLRGDLAAIGAECEYGENPDGTSRSGAVYLFRYDGAAWVREAKIYPSDVPEPWSPHYYFGENVSLGDDVLVVGSGQVTNPSNPDDWGSGAVYVFEREGESWAHAATLINDSADEQLNERFGLSVSISGTTLFVGAPHEDAPDYASGGAVYVFEREGNGWGQQAKVVHPETDPDGFFGYLLASSEGEALLGSFASPNMYPLRMSEGTWQVGAPLVLEDAPIAIARRGLLAFTVDRAGTGYLFSHSGSSWEETAFSVPQAEATRDELVSLTDQHAFIGIPTFDSGQVLVYDLGQFVDDEPAAEAPPALALSVAPNPAGDAAVIHFELPGPGAVRLTVYDVLGREVARLVEGALSAGPQTLRLETHGLADGTYLVRLETERQVVTKHMTVIR